MSDEAAFLRAIQANPADATAKLVYADWLDDHDESEKAAYVRTEVTMYALGRLQGLLAAFAMCSDHSANIGYSFDAHMGFRSEELQELADRFYGPNCQPVRLDRLDDWEAELRSVLRANLLVELGHLHGTHNQLLLQVEYGREAIIDTAMDYVRGVITPTAGWRARITEKRWYACAWDDLILEAGDRVLFLHFSSSD